MKKLTLLFTIKVFFLLSAMNGYSQFDKLPELLKGADSNVKSATSLLKGNVHVVTVRSLGLVGNILEDSPDRKVSVYLPPGYEANPQKRYPVLYLYMGYGYKHDAWFGGVDRNYDMSVVLDNLINQGKLNEFIVVSPDNYNKYYGSWFTNSNMSGSWEDFNAIDVVKYIDENFRTIPKPESRGISGWSMGGYGAVKLAMKYPETFSCLYSISGALLDFQHRLINLADEKKDFITAAKLTTINSSILYCYSIAIAFAPDKNAVGYGAMPVDTSGVVIDSVWQKYLAHDLASKIPDYKQNLLKLNKIVLECGTQEPPIYNENNSFSKKLKEYGINHLLNIHSGDHSYTINNRMDTHVFPFFSLNLANYEIGMNEICYTMNDTLKVNMFNNVGKLYITPDSTAAKSDEILSKQIFSVESGALDAIEIAPGEIGVGQFLAYGITSDGYVTKPVKFGISQNAPQLKVQIIDKVKGIAIPDCQVKINTSFLNTDQNGLVSYDGCGNRTIQITDTHVFGQSANLTVYVDTLLKMDVVKKSYLNIVDRATHLPVYRATFSCNKTQTYSDNKGLVTMQVVSPDSLLMYTITHTDYFSVTDTAKLLYADTLKIELTRKRATVEFYISDATGPVTDQKVQLATGSLTTNSEGKAKFNNRIARQNLQYTIQKLCYLPVEESFYLEIDTLINVLLVADTIPAKLTMEKVNEILKITCTKAGNIFVVPSGTALVTDSILKYQTMKCSVTENVTAEINSADITTPDYWMCYVDQCNNITKLSSGVVDVNEFANAGFKIYPNPAKDELTIQTNYNYYSIELSAITGKLIYTTNLSGNIHHISLKGLSQGIYFIKLKSGDYVLIQKILKM